MADQPQQSDVPEALQKSKDVKVNDAAVAEQAVASTVKKGDSFLVAVGYISFLCILPLVLLRENKFALFHGKQALVLAIFLFFFDVIQIFPYYLATLYFVFKIAIILYCIMMTVQGKYFKLPFLYQLSERFDIAIKAEEQKS